MARSGKEAIAPRYLYLVLKETMCLRRQSRGLS